MGRDIFYPSCRASSLEFSNSKSDQIRSPATHRQQKMPTRRIQILIASGLTSLSETLQRRSQENGNHTAVCLKSLHQMAPHERKSLSSLLLSKSEPTCPPQSPSS